MSGRFVNKFAGSGATDAPGNRSKAAGIGVDTSDSNRLKYNSGGTLVKVVDETNAPTLSSGSKVNLGGDTAVPSLLQGSLTDVTNAISGTVQNTEYVLNSITIKANAFNRVGQSIQVEAWLTLAANANAKNIKIYFGATAVATVTGSTASGKDVYISLSVVRLASNSQSAVGQIQVDTNVAPSMAIAALTETDTADIVISVKTANTAAAAASATGKGMIASFGN